MIDSDFYLSEETGQFRSHIFSIESKTEEECIKYIDGGMTDTLPIVPLTLLDFDVEWDNKSKSVQLVWNTKNEFNISRFIIERKNDVEDEFEEIGEVESLNMVENNRYFYNDDNVEKGHLYYYRLKIADQDGSYNFSNVESVLIPSGEFEVIYYPNPVMDKLFVIIENGASDTVIDLLDNMGRKAIRSITDNNSNNGLRKIEIDLNEIPEGQYFLKVVSGTNVSFNKVIHLK